MRYPPRCFQVPCTQSMSCCGEPLSAMFEADPFNSFQGLVFLFLALLLTSLLAHYILFSGALVPNLRDRHVLITGCDTGFGNELAVRLDALGVCVFATCFTRDGEERLKEKCSQKLKTLQLDVSKPDMVQKALEYVKAQLPPSRGLWGIVNNAGVASSGPIEWQTLESMKSLVDVNLWGTVDMTKTFLPLLKQSKGRIVNVASAMARCSLPGAASYSISKFGVVAFSDALRNEVKPFGVSVHIIEPGFFKTNVTNPKRHLETIDRLWEELSDEMKDSYGVDYHQAARKSAGEFLALFVSSDTSKVVKAMEHALVSASPKLRYLVGWDQFFFWRLLSFLPSRVQDFFLGMVAPKPKIQP